MTVFDKLKAERVDDTVHTDIKTVLSEFRKASKDEMDHFKRSMIEADKHNFSNELFMTKQRLVEIEESKSSLAAQVKFLG
jgi:hypothetical protein